MLAVSAAALVPHLAAAQDQGQPQPARQCIEELRTFHQRMEEEGLWLSGYRLGPGYGYGVYGVEIGPAGGPAAPPIDPARPEQPVAPAPDATSRTDGPWGAVQWQMAPSTEIRALSSAAYVLGQRGDQQTCDAVLSALREVYSGYAEQVRSAGIEPAEVTGWRHEQLFAARPLSELIRGGLRVDRLMDVDVRNPRDEYLGSVNDVIFDPGTGEIAYLTIGRGGFLGIGQESVPVPWEMLGATPGLNTLVVDISAEELGDAPHARGWRDNEEFQSWKRQADEFWSSRRES
jgi:sporulation protein YlmC with PRC-barrel domain